MSYNVTAEKQRKEEQNRDTSADSGEVVRIGQWIQDTSGALTTSPQREGLWPNYNITAVNATPQQEGCSRAPDDARSPGSKDTDAIVLESMTYVGGINFAKYRLEASRTKTSGKHQKLRPLTFCMHYELYRDNYQ